MTFRAILTALAFLALSAAPGLAQITVLDTAQDGGAVDTIQGGGAVDTIQDGITVDLAPLPPPPCGTRPFSIARMQWPSAALLAEIHARLLPMGFGCEVRVVAGDMAATGSSMAATGQPAMAPELWITRIAEVWNQAIRAQAARAAANSYTTQTFEGWYVPGYMADALPALSVAGLAQRWAEEEGDAPIGRLRFISCPPDWACAVINRNLLRAHGLTDRVELVTPANRFDMDRLIGEAVSRREEFLLYYWAPNAVLDQFGFVALEMGEYDEEALRCLARTACADPVPSAFASEAVVNALAEWVFEEAPRVLGYVQRASLPLAEMNALLFQLGQPGATIESVADRFVAEREDLWGPWLGQGAP